MGLRKVSFFNAGTRSAAIVLGTAMLCSDYFEIEKLAATFLTGVAFFYRTSLSGVRLLRRYGKGGVAQTDDG